VERPKTENLIIEENTDIERTDKLARKYLADNCR
jgi:hypothetical protein